VTVDKELLKHKVLDVVKETVPDLNPNTCVEVNTCADCGTLLDITVLVEASEWDPDLPLDDEVEVCSPCVNKRDYDLGGEGGE